MELETEDQSAQHRADPNQETPTLKRDNKIRRVAEQTQGLVGDVKEWVDLKIELTKIEIKEQIEEKANDLVKELQDKAEVAAFEVLEENEEDVRATLTIGVVLTMAVVAFVFVGIAGALALESVIGIPGLGFLIVGLLIGIAARLTWGIVVRPFIRKLMGAVQVKRHGKSIEQGGAAGKIEGPGSLDRRALPGPEGGGDLGERGGK